MEDIIKVLYINGENDKTSIQHLINDEYDMVFIKTKDLIRGYSNINLNNNLKLTKRERQILNFLMAGLSNKEISDMLEISIHTVKNHLYSIYNKLGVSGRTQAVIAAKNIHK